jgi:hypothetical protein
MEFGFSASWRKISMRMDFRIWLERHYLSHVASSWLSNIARIEQYYGDLDDHYARDRLATIARDLSYSREDQRVDRPNPSKIPLAEGANIYNGLATLRSAVNLYRRFRDETTIVPKPPPMPALQLYKAYTRREIHAIFEPGAVFVPDSPFARQGIVPLPTHPRCFLFFVTPSDKIGFRQGIFTGGVLRWRSKDDQTQQDPQIRQLIQHDESGGSIFLFLKTPALFAGNSYAYMGTLRYLRHDPHSQKPVQFEWQLLNWPVPEDVRAQLGLDVETSPLDIPPNDQTLDGSKLLARAIIDLNIDLPALVARCAIWANPQVVNDVMAKRPHAVWFPNSRRAKTKSGERVGTIVDGIYLDNNSRANLAIKQVIFSDIRQCRGMHTCHVWARTCYDARYHTSLANLVLIPAPLAGLTDHDEQIASILRYRAFELHGWHPEGVAPPPKLDGYPAPETWAAMRRVVPAVLKRVREQKPIADSLCTGTTSVREMAIPPLP